MLKDPRTREMIHSLKYGRKIHLASELGRLTAESFCDVRLEAALEEKWPLIPVPLHSRRFQERHFNQAAEIARSVGKIYGLPVVCALLRNRSTEHQTLLSRAERFRNLKGAFALTRCGKKLAGRSAQGAILVDDVFTTGSTVNACAAVLRKAGFKKIVVITVMRG